MAVSRREIKIVALVAPITILLGISGCIANENYVQRDTIGDYKICLDSNSYNLFNNQQNSIQTKDSDSPESTKRLQIMLNKSSSIYSNLADLSDDKTKDKFFHIVVRHYQNGASSYRDRKAKDLQKIIDQEGEYKFHTVNHITNTAIEIRPPYKSTTGFRHYFQSQTNNIFESWISSCFFESEESGSCHISDVFKHDYYVEINFSSEFRLKSFKVKSLIFDWLDTKVMRDQCS